MVVRTAYKLLYIYIWIIISPSGEEHNEPHVSEKKVEEKGTHESNAEHDHHEGHTHRLIDDHSLIGVTLVSGFIFMLFVDQIGGGGHMHAPSGNPRVLRGCV